MSTCLVLKSVNTHRHTPEKLKVLAMSYDGSKLKWNTPSCIRRTKGPYASAWHIRKSSRLRKVRLYLSESINAASLSAYMHQKETYIILKKVLQTCYRPLQILLNEYCLFIPRLIGTIHLNLNGRHRKAPPPPRLCRFKQKSIFINILVQVNCWT